MKTNIHKLIFLYAPLLVGPGCVGEPPPALGGEETETSSAGSATTGTTGVGGTTDAAVDSTGETTAVAGGSSGGETGSVGPCELAANGTECDVAHVCLDGECVLSVCGDGFVDTNHGEQCEDGNIVGGDGCESTCVWTCSGNEDCDDGNVCTGVEVCQADHTCSNPSDIGCDDGNNCTLDTCDAVSGCKHDLVDMDGDGYAWSGLGACGPGTAGGDCNDGDPAVYPGAYDGCDGAGVDADCDGQVDEDGTGLWYEDCDGDGFAPAGAQVAASCNMPGVGPGACAMGSWTTANPAIGTPDCDDHSAADHPGAVEIAGNGDDDNCDGQELCYRDQDNDGYRTDETISTGVISCNGPGIAPSSAELEWQNAGAKNLCCDQDADMHRGQTGWFSFSDGPAGNPACPAGRKWDFDCDGSEERRWTTAVNQCFWEPAGCSRGGDPDTSGWATGGVIVDCGTPAFPWNSNCHENAPFSCTFDLSVREQDCH